MTPISVPDHARQIRASLANALTNISQALEAHSDAEGTAQVYDAPELVSQMQGHIARAAVLAAEWSQAYYSGDIPLPGQEMLPGFEWE